MNEEDKKFMTRAIELAESGMNANKGGPFGAVIVKNGEIIAESCNMVTSENDPTAHAEVEAIRKACKKLNDFQLDGCVIYTSCEPCPMCLGAIYWARLQKVYYGCTREDASKIEFDDHFIYDEIAVGISNRKIVFTNLMRVEANKVFHKWKSKPDKTDY